MHKLLLLLATMYVNVLRQTAMNTQNFFRQPRAL